MDGNVIRKWSELRGLPVTIPSQGREIGVVENFFFKAGTSAIDSLLVQTGLQGYRAVPASGISTIEKDKITLPHQQVLLRAIPVLPTGSELLDYKVVGESGTEVGKVGEIWIAVNPPLTLRVAAIELTQPANKQSGRAKRITDEEILRYQNETIVIDDQDARRLR